jgi:hypothetical protein
LKQIRINRAARVSERLEYKLEKGNFLEYGNPEEFNDLMSSDDNDRVSMVSDLSDTSDARGSFNDRGSVTDVRGSLSSSSSLRQTLGQGKNNINTLNNSASFFESVRESEADSEYPIL